MSNSSANERQVGGSHYAGTYQHWDFAEDAQLAGHEWQVTRYISRHRKKNGLQDVLKAGHHVQKMIELLCSRGRKPGYGPAALRAFSRFDVTNAVAHDDAMIMALVVSWKTESDLHHCARLIERLASEYQQAEIAAKAKQAADALPATITAMQADAVDETAGLPPVNRSPEVQGEGSTLD